MAKEKWKEKYKSSDGYKRVMVNTKTGEERVVIEDQKHREMVKRGDFLQPIGKDRKQFFDKYPHMKGQV